MDHNLTDMLANLSMNDSSALQPGTAGDHVYKETPATGRIINDNLAAAFLNVVFSDLVTSTVIPTASEVVPYAPTTTAATDVGTCMSSAEGVSEGNIDTMIEEGIGLPNDDTITDLANSTEDSRFVQLVGPLWEYGREARASTTTSERRVLGANTWEGDLFETPSAIVASNPI